MKGPEWLAAPFGELPLEIIDGDRSANYPKRSEFVPEGVPFLNSTNIHEGHFDATDLNFISEEKAASIKKGRAKPGDIVMTTRGSIGKVAVFPSIFPVGVINAQMLLVRSDPGKLDQLYLFHVMRGPEFQGRVRSFASGSAQPQIPIRDLKHVPVLLPPLPTQQRIAAILSAYDDLIENNTRRIAILEEMARRLYEEWFVHFRFPGHEEAEFGETELGRTPQSWRVQVVAQTFEITGGGTPSKKVEEYWDDGTIEWFSPTDLTRAATMFMDGSSSKITPLGLRKSSARLFPPFSVMMTSRATIGAIAINTTEACTNQGFITCIPNDRFPLHLLLHWLRDNVEMFISLASGATFKEISKGVFKEIKLLVPSQHVADRFERTVGPIMKEALVLQRKNTNLRAQRDMLLPKLVSGEIGVSHAEATLEAAE